ncbi:PREDICTED: uncharacterized protein LOC105566068 [Vollenhovia emeryi]|uniref:uncharacterized protein LOC105566068 n=1 Tax=Vollenhovia emeryi TaxID=411798 RepID=UPI0005F4302C|nr:PREDICTED: uncharacterized protein LOC105566068 [Vollenhovia emeryi]
MSTDSHDQTKPCKTPARSEEESAFDGKRIKKEHGDVCVENGDAATIAVAAAAATTTTSATSASSAAAATTVLEKRQPPAGRFASNGFHGDGDQLQDLVATKFATLANHGASSKQDKIRIVIEDGISEESRAHVEEIFSRVERLKIEEKLLLYLKLPLLLRNPSGIVDPLRQPLNPLGNRYEIHQTIMWIKTHLEEDPDVSLPKQEVYDEYNMYCIRNSMKPLSTADFGKVMKQVYPRVRPRRLGTRGNSRYCYAGMRKRIKLGPPTLPKISGSESEEHSEENVTEEMLGAASTLIREWAEKTLGQKFPNLSALARHLVDNFCVDTHSLAAVCILATSGQHDASSNKEVISDLPTTPVSGKPAKLREAQLQLQRKLQQREHIKDQKHRCPDSGVQNKEKVIDSKGNVSKGCKKVKSNQSPQDTNAAATTVVTPNSLTKLNLSTVVCNRQRKVSKTCNQQQQQQQTCNVSQESNCDNLVVQSRDDRQSNSNLRVMMSAQRDVKGKNSRKRANNPIVAQQEPSPEKQTKLTEESPEHSNALLPKLASIQRSGKISVILASNSKSIKCKPVDTADNRLAKNCDIDSSKSSTTGNVVETSSRLLTGDQIRLLQDTPVFKDEKVRDIDTDALDDYLNGGNNSQEQEEELLQYFQQSSSSSSDVETSVVGSDAEQISRSDKVSQLRLILQQNLKAPVIAADLTPVTLVRQSAAESVVEKRDPVQKHNLILPTLLNHPNPGNTRRRVSFETNVVEHVQEAAAPSVANTVPQSPNTRRRIFNFTPISPGPHSPINGRASKSNSANASPFVSPRNTPVPRSRSNLQAGSSRSRGQKTLSRSISCSVPYTIKTTDTFIVPTSSGAEHARQVLTATTKTSEVLKRPPSTYMDFTPQKQLLINYPSQENLQEIKNVYQKGQPPPLDQEITELLDASRQWSNEQLFCRSQSVPLRRMINPVSLMSPISTQQCLSSVQSQSFNPSTSSSVAPTPVPSEYNDFGSAIGQESTYLLDDTNFMSDEQPFLMTDKGITSENINNILTILDEEDQPNLQMLSEQTTEEALSNNTIVLNALPNANLNLSEEDMLDPSSILTDASGTLQKIMQSRSYPNTPLPAPVSAYTPSYTEDSNGSRSYPSTPLHTMQSQEVYQDPGEPILSSPILNSLSLQGDVRNVAVVTVTGAAAASSNSLCRNVADLLEASFLGEADTETDDLDHLGNFDGLQDMDSLTPLFNEVTEPNR